MLMRPVVETKSGPVEGLIEEFNGIKGYSFRGIPYAADTSGNNRWRAPHEEHAICYCLMYQQRNCLLYTSPSPRDRG